jgi:hypothetical protein
MTLGRRRGPSDRVHRGEERWEGVDEGIGRVEGV